MKKIKDPNPSNLKPMGVLILGLLSAVPFSAVHAAPASEVVCRQESLAPGDPRGLSVIIAKNDPRSGYLSTVVLLGGKIISRPQVFKSPINISEDSVSFESEPNEFSLKLFGSLASNEGISGYLRGSVTDSDEYGGRLTCQADASVFTEGLKVRHENGGVFPVSDERDLGTSQPIPSGSGSCSCQSPILDLNCPPRLHHPCH